MLLNLNSLQEIYKKLSLGTEHARSLLNKPLTLTEKILYGHLYDGKPDNSFKRGIDYVNFAPDRVAMQDATAQMALLQFMTAGRKTAAVPATVHCDHLIQASIGVKSDLPEALKINDMSQWIPAMAKNVMVVLITQLLLGIGYILATIIR